MPNQDFGLLKEGSTRTHGNHHTMLTEHKHTEQTVLTVITKTQSRHKYFTDTLCSDQRLLHNDHGLSLDKLAP